MDSELLRAAPLRAPRSPAPGCGARSSTRAAWRCVRRGSSCADTPSALTTDRTRGSRIASGDVGEEISAREAPHLHFFDISSQRGPGDIGTVFSDVVYHNFYGTRFGAGQAELDSGIVPDDPRSAWAEALDRYVR